MKTKLIAGLCIAVATAIAGVSAQDFPSRPIKMLIGFGAGGPTDLSGRLFADALSRSTGQPVAVENRPGGTGVIAAQAVAQANPDGYTLLFTANAHTASAALKASLPFNPVDDFTPIVLLSSISNVIAVNAKSEFRTLKDYLDKARARPSTVTYASSGIGTPLHFGGEQLAHLSGVKLSHIPYKSGAESIQAVIRGDVDASVSGGVPFIVEG